eukprot:1443885-Rhodomonas_salina.1
MRGSAHTLDGCPGHSRRLCDAKAGKERLVLAACPSQVRTMRRPSRPRKAFGQCICNVVCSSTLDQNHNLVPDQVQHIVPTSVNVPSKLAVYQVVGNLNAGHVVLPDLRW